LEEAADRPVKTYSKGMRQRLGLAQAFLGDPKLLILDEPTVGLDPVATSEFYQMVDKLKTHGCAVILCTHVLPGIEAHIDRAMIMSEGRKLALGTLDQLREDACLPTEFSVQGLTQSEIKSLLNGHLANALWLDELAGKQRFTVDLSEKLPVMKKLLDQNQVQDLHIKQPSLETIYHHYLGHVRSVEQREGAL
jgi:Cu-processing system ATP-binding protein